MVMMDVAPALDIIFGLIVVRVEAINTIRAEN